MDSLILAASMELEIPRPTDAQINGAIASAAYRTGFSLTSENCAEIFDEVKRVVRRKII